MDSPQKVLKELSDLTRNLDVLAKEIRDMSKGNATVAKAVVQSVETKKEDSKSAATSAEKTTADAQKAQEGMFSKLLGSVKKSFEEGNELFKSASLKALSSAGKTLLETGSLKEAAKSGISEAKDSAKKSAGDLAKQKAEQLITTSTTVNQAPDLKQKEKTSPTAGSPAAASAEVKTPAALSPKVGATASTDEDSPKKSFKDVAKEEFGKTRLGSTVNYISGLTKKKKDSTVAESGMKSETTTLKDQAKAKSEPAKPQAEAKKEAEVKKETSYASVQSAEPKKGESKSSAPASAGSGSSDKGKETQISSQDIQDIKGLLAAINTTLTGPLSIKNNKPFRPTSNMLG